MFKYSSSRNLLHSSQVTKNDSYRNSRSTWIVGRVDRFFFVLLFVLPSLLIDVVEADQNEVPAMIKSVDPQEWFDECLKTFMNKCCTGVGDPHILYSNLDLMDKPSGLCTNHLSCAFKECSDKGFDVLFGKNVNYSNPNLWEEIKENFGQLNLPEKITFPKTVDDATAAIDYARAQNLKVSIKTSSHSYTGSSTVGGSVQLNLRDFEKYATSDSVVECDNINDESDENWNACKLAEARGKKAFLKIGGGQTWSEAYQAVMNANTSVRYDIVGGGAGSVGAAGGWLQGGGWSHGVERMYGLGIDQLLEIEMVLANGSHISFGPTEWEEAPGYIYPKTTKVEGKCKNNPNGWGPCPAPGPPFQDLWFAVRGGGGGSFGLVTAVKYQLHETRPFEVVSKNETAFQSWLSLSGGGYNQQHNSLGLWFFFLIDLLYRPENLGIDQETSSKCGDPGLDFNLLGGSRLMCYDNVWTDILADKWKERVDFFSNMVVLKTPLKNLWFSTSYDSYPHWILSIAGYGFYPNDTIPDLPLPSFIPDKGYGGWCSAVIPAWWLADISNNVDIITVFINRPGSHVTGGFMNVAHDQMTSLPPPQRESGLSSPNLGGLDPALLSRLLKSFLNSTTADTFSGGITEINHVCIGSYGPLKSDITKICPSNYTDEQKKAECISMHESIWGKEILSRLQDIKYRVDPDGIFDCNICIQPVIATPTDTSDGTNITDTSDGTNITDTSDGRSIVTSNFQLVFLVCGVVATLLF